MWASVQSAITSANDDPLTAGNAILDKALGPSFDYLQTIQSPSNLNVGDQGTLDQVGTNANAINTYVKNLITGPKSGNQFFKDTGGMCRTPGSRDDKGNDKGDGPVVPRFTYTNNRMGMDDAAAVLGPSFSKAVAGSGFDGIIPAMGGDIAAMNPLKLMNGLVLDGVPPCVAYTCPVTDIQSGVPQGDQTRFISPSLEFNITPCRAATGSETSNLMAMIAAEKKAAEKAAKEAAEREAAANIPKPKPAATPKKGKVKGVNASGERYANFQENLYQAPVPVEYVDPVSYLTLGAAVMVFIGYILMK
jgi:hypothetical protein